MCGASRNFHAERRIHAEIDLNFNDGGFYIIDFSGQVGDLVGHVLLVPHKVPRNRILSVSLLFFKEQQWLDPLLYLLEGLGRNILGDEHHRRPRRRHRKNLAAMRA